MRKFIGLLVICIACGQEKETNKLDIQGHRGARGLAPENTIPGFIMAANLAVTTLELDVVVSRDSQLVVSHEPYFSPAFCIDPLGNPIPQDSIINIYEMYYHEIKTYDCGTTRNPRFPEQRRIATFKPLLSEVIDSVESFAYKKGRTQLHYNIELKTTEETDNIFHPSPEIFSNLVYELISEKGIWDRVNIQSFDFRTLQYFRQKYPDVKLALLIENELTFRENIDSLGFRPEIYSCYYQLLSQEKVKEIQKEDMKVIPWTVNDFFDINKMLSWGVDGIISDYPDRVLTIAKSK